MRMLPSLPSLASLVQWVDADYSDQTFEQLRAQPDRIDWVRCIPFGLLHLGCLGVIWVGWSWPAVVVAIGLYVVRMFAITGFYHRYFSHRSFRTGRLWQFVFAFIGASSAQRGPLWWAAQHRHHHRHSDEEEDAHSPVQHGFWWAHIGWITSPRNFPTDYRQVRDLAKYPELRFLNRFDLVAPLALAVGLFAFGAWLGEVAPSLGASGAQMLVWGFFISTTVLFHGTSAINSLAHQIGTRRFETRDDSRNSFVLSLITLGEGWHNNHHQFMSSARQGLRWWEFEPTWYGLKLLAALRVIRDLKPHPAAALRAVEAEVAKKPRKAGLPVEEAGK